MRIEKQQRLEQIETIGLAQLFKEVIEDSRAALKAKEIKIEMQTSDSIEVRGEHLYYAKHSAICSTMRSPLALRNQASRFLPR